MMVKAVLLASRPRWDSNPGVPPSQASLDHCTTLLLQSKAAEILLGREQPQTYVGGKKGPFVSLGGLGPGTEIGVGETVAHRPT